MAARIAPTPKRRARPVRRTDGDRLQSIEKILQLLGSDIVRLIERMPMAERLQTENAAHREHIAVLASQVRRLLGEKDILLGDKRALKAYIAGLEEQIPGRITITEKTSCETHG